MKTVAILGCGTVGGGVAALLRQNAEEIARRTGEELRLKYILVRRDDGDSPFRALFVKDFQLIESDPEVDIVAECIGGVGAPLEYVRRALRAGKSVVTSNKELVAAYGAELCALARERGVSFLFEASVGGSIPVLRALLLSLAGDRITEAVGVLNGTTNYILTAMERRGASFADALAEAQALGYAEQDPSADVLGWDAGRKICILADLCFGKNVDPALVPMEGVTGVTGKDIAAAAALGCRVKLLCRAARAEGGKAAVYVAPHLVPVGSPLAALEGVDNGVLIRGEATGETFLRGAGAGRFPTAVAMLGDIMDAAQCAPGGRAPRWEAAEADYLADPEAVESRWYVRCGAARAEAERAFPDARFADTADCAFLTPPMTGAELRRSCAALAPESIFRVLKQEE